MQETTFPLEIVVDDCASGGRIADIIREYDGTFSELSKPALQTGNHYSQRNPAPSHNSRRAHGDHAIEEDAVEYVFLVRGDIS